KRPKDKLFDLDLEKMYHVVFQGEKTETSDAHLYFIMYPKVGNPRSEIIPLGNEMKFNLLPDTESVRIGIKFIGKGKIDFKG
ncbi:hypothetical protein WAJ64_23035, partial [Acinetobacter baumannii]